MTQTQQTTTGYFVDNLTDGILLFPEPFATRQEAEQYRDDFLGILEEHQGYWRALDGRAIPIDELQTEIFPDDGRPRRTRFEFW